MAAAAAAAIVLVSGLQPYMLAAALKAEGKDRAVAAFSDSLEVA